MVTILVMSAKMIYLGLLKINVFQNKDYDAIISVHDVINKIISRDLRLHCKCAHITKVWYL